MIVYYLITHDYFVKMYFFNFVFFYSVIKCIKRDFHCSRYNLFINSEIVDVYNRNVYTNISLKNLSIYLVISFRTDPSNYESPIGQMNLCSV